MDRITKALLENFVSENGLTKLDENEQFEHFTGSLLVSKHYSENFESEDIHVGSGGDSGIDAIGILVNGCLVTEPDEIEDLCETNGYLDVTLVFVQSERSSSFDTAKIGQFGFGTRDFLSENPGLVQNEKIIKKAKIINQIFDRSSKFKSGNPLCHLYYVTTGKWVEDKNLTARKNAEKKDLEDLNIFRKFSFDCIDAGMLQDLHRLNQNSINSEIIFTERIVLPELPGVEQAYLGLVKSSEFFKLIENSDEEILTSIFYDNVRHWQEMNPVNQEILDTINNANTQIYFPLFNNGITIVAKRINPTGNRFMIEDYQIVNGCQTSFILHHGKSSINGDILIPIRLIATKDVDIRNNIIKATNRQTAVTDEQLFALSDFPKQLENYFPTFDGNKKLYYERRSRQYNAETDVEKVRVINMTTLVRSFSSVFLEWPHRTTRNYKALLKTVGSDIFNKDHRLEMYYLSAFAHYRLEFLFRNQIIEPKLKPARYHLLMLFRILSNPKELPRLNSHEMVKYCSPIIDNLWDEEKYKEIFLLASKIIIEVAGGNLHSDNIRTEPFTAKILAYVANFSK